MRKHIDYFYKCYDKMYQEELERIQTECFNEYGYNFDTNTRRTMDKDEWIKKTNYNQCKKKLRKKILNNFSRLR